MLVKKTLRNQLTLPKEIVKAFSNTVYFDVSVKDRKIILVPVDITLADATLDSVRDRLRTLGLTERDVTEAIAWTRKKRCKRGSS